MNSKLIFTGQTTPEPKIIEYRYPVTSEMWDEVKEEMRKECTSWFNSDKELEEFINNPRHFEIVPMKVRIFKYNEL